MVKVTIFNTMFEWHFIISVNNCIGKSDSNSIKSVYESIMLAMLTGVEISAREGGGANTSYNYIAVSKHINKIKTKSEACQKQRQHTFNSLEMVANK